MEKKKKEAERLKKLKETAERYKAVPLSDVETYATEEMLEKRKDMVYKLFLDRCEEPLYLRSLTYRESKKLDSPVWKKASKETYEELTPDEQKKFDDILFETMSDVIVKPKKSAKYWRNYDDDSLVNAFIVKLSMIRGLGALGAFLKPPRE